MITHVVLLKPKDGLSGEERIAFVAAFRRAVEAIPAVRGVRVGTRRRHGAGYEGVAPDTADFIALLDFDDLEGLHEYLQHPAHGELSVLFGLLLTSAMVFDFETGGLDLLQTFI